MKKIYLLFALSLVAIATQAQVEIGVQFSPTLSTTRLTTNTEAYDFSKYKSGIRFNAGIVGDFFLRDNIALSTGFWYSVKRTGVTTADTTAGVPSYNSMTNTQYLNLPIGFKFYTQEIVPDMRLFLQLGGVADFKISKDKIKLDSKELVNPSTYSKFFDASMLVSIGTEMKLGNNKVFGSIFYNRGLVSMLTKKYSTALNSTNLKLNSDQMGLSIGYKF
jgi:hypothetical protein